MCEEVTEQSTMSGKEQLTLGLVQLTDGGEKATGAQSWEGRLLTQGSFTLQIRNLQLRHTFIYNLKRTGIVIHEILDVVCFKLFQNTFVEYYGKN